MRLARIKNRYIYHSDNPNGYHTYLVYHDKNDNKDYAITTTHLYNPDRKRMLQVRAGVYKKMRFDGFDCPSGIYKKPIKQNVYGAEINLNSKDVRLGKYVSKSKAKKVLRFINKSK